MTDNYTEQIHKRAKEVANEWFNLQIKNPFERFYLYHTQGDFAVGMEPPSGYKLSSNERISPSWTKERAEHWINETAQKLPILPLKPVKHEADIKGLNEDLRKKLVSQEEDVKLKSGINFKFLNPHKLIFTVYYNQAKGNAAHKDFTDPSKAFKFWASTPMRHNSQPFISVRPPGANADSFPSDFKASGYPFEIALRYIEYLDKTGDWVKFLEESHPEELGTQELKKELSKGEIVTIPEKVLKATADIEPSEEVKKWMKKAHNIDDYKGGRSDRRSMLAYILNYYTIGNIRDRSEASNVAWSLGKDLGYGTPPSTGMSWERYFAEKIANETGKDVSIIKNAVVVHPASKSEPKQQEPPKRVEEPKLEPKPKMEEKIDTGDKVLDGLLESSENVYRAANKSDMRPYARKYSQAVYNFLLHGGEEPDVPEKLKQANNFSTAIDKDWEEKTKSLFHKALEAAKKTKSLQVKHISAGKTIIVPEKTLKEISIPVSEKENQRRVDLMNERIKTKRILNVGVFHDGKLVKGGFKDAYSAHNFMNDSFFIGHRANKIGMLSPEEFGWNIHIIDEKTDIINLDELKNISKGIFTTPVLEKQISKGETVVMPQSTLMKHLEIKTPAEPLRLYGATSASSMKLLSGGKEIEISGSGLDRLLLPGKVKVKGPGKHHCVPPVKVHQHCRRCPKIQVHEYVRACPKKK